MIPTISCRQIHYLDGKTSTKPVVGSVSLDVYNGVWMNIQLGNNYMSKILVTFVALYVLPNECWWVIAYLPVWGLVIVYVYRCVCVCKPVVQWWQAKLKTEKCHQQLQNLLYEAMHLQKEIRKCVEFRLVSVTPTTAHPVLLAFSVNLLQCFLQQKSCEMETPW